MKKLTPAEAIQIITDKNRQRPRVKPDQVGVIVMNGDPLLVGEYRGTSCEIINWSDKETGKPLSFLKIGHTVEMTKPDGSVDTITVSERAPEGFLEPAAFVSGLKKGQTIAVKLQNMILQKGHLTVGARDSVDSIQVIEAAK